MEQTKIGTLTVIGTGLRRARCDERVDLRADRGDANRVMAPGLRPKRIAELESEIERLCRIEEQLVLQAIDQNESVERRSGCPAQAILQVRIAAQKAAPIERKRVA